MSSTRSSKDMQPIADASSSNPSHPQVSQESFKLYSDIYFFVDAMSRHSDEEAFTVLLEKFHDQVIRDCNGLDPWNSEDSGIVRHYFHQFTLEQQDQILFWLEFAKEIFERELQASEKQLVEELGNLIETPSAIHSHAALSMFNRPIVRSPSIPASLENIICSSISETSNPSRSLADLAEPSTPIEPVSLRDLPNTYPRSSAEERSRSSLRFDGPINYLEEDYTEEEINEGYAAFRFLSIPRPASSLPVRSQSAPPTSTQYLQVPKRNHP